jgi:hypothetical protein
MTLIQAEVQYMMYRLSYKGRGDISFIANSGTIIRYHKFIDLNRYSFLFSAHKIGKKPLTTFS